MVGCAVFTPAPPVAKPSHPSLALGWGAAALVGKALFKQVVHGIGTGQAGFGCCFKQALTDRYAARVMCAGVSVLMYHI